MRRLFFIPEALGAGGKVEDRRQCNEWETSGKDPLEEGERVWTALERLSASLSMVPDEE